MINLSDTDLQAKLQRLKDILTDMGNAVIAYSGGVDSTFLLKVAHDVLGDNVIAVTARSSTYPEREFNEACELVKQIGAKHVVIISEELEIEGFRSNPVNRCYYCKKELFNKIWDIANEHGINHVLDGSNVDDTDDFRPGMKAAHELGVESPLRESGMTKSDIRALSKAMGLPTWNKPSFACLSSRFPYGQPISEKKLSMVEQAEQFLLDKGFIQVRVRYHGDIARIEVAPEERHRFFDEHLMDEIAARFKQIGFAYTALDLAGYRTGSMNEVLKEEMPDERTTTETTAQ
ncbi:ATP-dependent sacrificial sulfur transferase LarE [Mahella australiensis]|uniref:PP-loop domain protein n=1 Tax=Mahella australiensis (strain DSM 15567 / CIP 107919 / 50-1 BON) TaxID=697281 RepID=F4A146_MAHA5|nr:ATP-dependent sacrificial sulfur transferase LarE [Mahella australiensis]AEE95949.1 PP-loop domain protein [Mahella australiensis 50-1 BON]